MHEVGRVERRDWGSMVVLLLLGVAAIFCVFAVVNGEWDVAMADAGLSFVLASWLNARLKG